MGNGRAMWDCSKLDFCKNEFLFQKQPKAAAVTEGNRIAGGKRTKEKTERHGFSYSASICQQASVLLEYTGEIGFTSLPEVPQCHYGMKLSYKGDSMTLKMFYDGHSEY